MKKVLCLLLAMLMLFSTTASASELYDFATMKNYEAEIDLIVKLDDPLEFLDKIPDIEEVYNYIDLDALIDSLLSSQINFQIKGNISEDFTKCQASIVLNSVNPVVFNKNAKITGEFVFGYWIDGDFSDMENPKLNAIVQSPFMNKYLTIDIIELIKNDEETYSNLKSCLRKVYNKEYIEETAKTIIGIVEKNATITKRNNTLTVNFDKDSANQYVYDMFEWAFKNIASYEEELFSVEQQTLTEETLEEIKSLSFFGDEGIKAQLVFDRSGKITSSSVVTDFDVNLYTFFEFLFYDMGEISEDECQVSLKLTENATYKSVGRAKVDYPKLNSENSVTFEEIFGIPDFDDSDDYEYTPYYIYLNSPYVVYKDSSNIYAGVRGFLEKIDYYHYSEDENHFEYNYTDGILTIKNTGCTFLSFKEVTLSVGESVVMADGVEIVLDKPVIEENDSIYISLDFYEKVFGYECTRASHNIFDDIVSLNFHRIVKE